MSRFAGRDPDRTAQREDAEHMAGDRGESTAASHAGLALALTPEALKPALAEQLGLEDGRPGRIAELRVLRADTPAKRAMFLYEVRLEAPDGESVRQIYSGRLVPGDRWNEDYQAAREAARV